MNAITKGIVPFLGLLLPLAACTAENRPQVAEENPAFSECAREAHQRFPGADQADARAEQLNTCLRAPRVALIQSF